MENIKTFILSENNKYSKVISLNKNSENKYYIDLRLKVMISGLFRFTRCGICLTFDEYEKLCEFLTQKSYTSFGTEERLILIEETNHHFIRKITLIKTKNDIITTTSILLTDQEINKIINYINDITKILCQHCNVFNK